MLWEEDWKTIINIATFQDFNMSWYELAKLNRSNVWLLRSLDFHLYLSNQRPYYHPPGHTDIFSPVCMFVGQFWLKESSQRRRSRLAQTKTLIEVGIKGDSSYSNMQVFCVNMTNIIFEWKLIQKVKISSRSRILQCHGQNCENQFSVYLKYSLRSVYYTDGKALLRSSICNLLVKYMLLNNIHLLSHFEFHLYLSNQGLY